MNNASSRQVIFAKRFRRTSLSVALLGAFSGGAYALPQDGVVAAGTAAINQSGSTMTITQDSARAILDWQSFGIASGELVQFLQPSSSAVVLNRVLGNNASEIYGQLSANGQVFLTNPNGILFGAGAQVDVGGFVASTLGISNEDFLAGNYAFSGADGGVISNAGTISAQSVVALLAPEVRNDGLIVAQAVGIGAGTGITLDLVNGLKLEVTESALNAVIENRTAIRADGGTIILTATAQQALLGGMINNTGVLAASSLVDDGGTISLVAGFQSLGGDISADGAQGGTVDIVGRNIDQYGSISARGTAGDGGTVNVQGERLIQTASGAIDASGSTNGGDLRLALGNDTGGAFLSGTLNANGEAGNGGDIAITGADLALVAAQVNANGDTGGGQVRIGGDYQGNNPGLPNARTTYINSSTRISADAGTAGNGGRVIVWSEESTEFNGSISARGGVTGGYGGFVEVSGRESLAFAGDVDLQAPNGDNGLLLLDPKNITISTAGSVPAYRLLDPNAAAGNFFGGSVEVVGGGNVAVTSYGDDFAAAGAGAAYLFNTETGALISAVRGSTASDYIGYDGLVSLGNGNYLVRSSAWDNGAVVNAGAVTWGSGSAGISGVVSAANSLVGSTANDWVGYGGTTAYGVTALASGNYVVRVAGWDNGAVVDAGAVAWGNGGTGTFGAISAANALVGSTANDLVGNGGITQLTNGHYVISSINWDNAGIGDAGAVTWGNGSTGIFGAVNAANSLVGSTAGDQVGSQGIRALGNGNYLVLSSYWNNGSATDAGAVTWGSGSTGVAGAVSDTNSLVGSTSNDLVGGTNQSSGVTLLGNGNYVLYTATWDNGGVVDAGAVTWGNGSTGTSGVIGAANSLVGSTANDQVGFEGATALTNGNYVVRSYFWDNGAVADAGAVTWGDGAAGIVGTISAANSLVGSTASDSIGNYGVTVLSNGNYVVRSPNWDNGAVADAGAATWGNGTTGIVGAVSATNSLVGSTATDRVSWSGVDALSNGNYVVRGIYWDNGAVTNAGAATWGNGSTGIVGVVSAANSLVGSTAYDGVGVFGVVELTNGNYVLRNANWDNGAVVNVGAVTWGSGTAGVSGAVSAANSLIGSTANDNIGNFPIVALSNGNYVVNSFVWNNGAVVDAGAVTWGNGSTGTVGAVSAANSLVGSATNDYVGIDATVALTNGNYVVRSRNWDNGAIVDAGAATWGNGSTGTFGAVSAANSLVGGTASDLVGYEGVTALANGNYVVRNRYWDNGAAVDAGAVTWGNGSTGIVGTVSASNSLVGSTTNDTVGAAYIWELSSGDYVVHSPAWDNGGVVNAGAVTWGSGTSGVSGVISASNSLLGNDSGLLGSGGYVQLANGNYVVVTRAGDGHLDYVDVDGSLTYTQATGQSLTIHPDALLRILNQGTNITLQASNDITVSAALLANNASGDGGNFTLQAGRSLLLNAGITTDNGDLTLIANDLLANGVINADRDAGAAVITATGQAIDAGTGTVTVDLRSGAGKTNSASGDINLGTITADTILVTNNGPTAGSDVIVNGALTATGTGDALTLVGDNVTNNAGSLAANNGRWLVYVTDALASDPFASFAYDFKQYNATYGVSAVLGTGNGFLLAQAPTVTASLTGTVSKEYDATTAATLAAGNYALSGVVQGDTVTINNPASGTYDNKNAGTGKTVDVTGVAITGTDNGGRTVYGYQLASASISGAVGTVTAKALDATAITAADKVYNATTAATLDTTVAGLAGAILGDVVSLDVTSATGTFANKNVGLNKTVTVNNLALAGTDAGNYTLNAGYMTTADITALAIDASGITASDKTYDATVAALLNVGSAGLAGAILGDTVSLDVGTAAGAFDTKNVGLNKTVTVSGLALAGADAGNYTINTYTTTADINALALDVSGITAADKVYNATTAATLDTTAANISGVLGSEVVTLDATAATGAFDTKNVGVAKTVTVSSLALTGADAGNYTLNVYTTSADITALAIDASGITAGDKVYDATTAATLDTTVAGLAGAILGDTVSLDVITATGAFDTKDVGLAKTVTVSGLALAGTDAGNYSLNTYTTTADVSALAIDASGITAIDKTYDATTTATLDTTAASLAGAIAGDTVSLDVTTAAGAFANKNVGLNKTVTVSGLALAGTDAGNYTLNAGYTTSADISALTIDATGITAADKMYDGLPTATLDATAAGLAGVLGGDTVTLDVTGAVGAFSDDIAGFNKTVSVSGLLLAGLDAGNYLLNPYTTTADIGLVFSLEQSGVEIHRYTHEETEGWRRRAVTLGDVPAPAIDRCGIRTGLSGAGRPPCDKE